MTLVLTGCPESPPPPTRDSGPRRDSGPFDAGTVPDTGPTDAATPDAPSADAGFTCAVDPGNVFDVGSDIELQSRTVRLAAGPSSFALLWNERRVGRPDLYARVYRTDGTDGGEQRLTDNTSREGRPAVVAQGTQWIGVWPDNDDASSGSMEIRTQLLADTAAVSGTRQIATLTATLIEENPVIYSGSDGVLAAWTEVNSVAGTRVVRTRTFGTNAVPTGTVQLASPAGSRPQSYEVADLSSGPHLVWAESSFGSGDISLQRLSSVGAAVGASVPLTTTGIGDGSVDAALTTSGGAVVYGVLVGGVTPQVRFLGLDTDGAPIGSERILSTVGSSTGASIARFAGGYAVSVRQEALGLMPASIELLLVSEVGVVLDQIRVADASPNGGRTTVRVSGDGQIGIAWADLETESEIHFALVRCGGP